MTSLFGGQVY